MGWHHHIRDIYDSVLQRYAVAVIVQSQAKENHQVHLLDGTRAYCFVSPVHFNMIGVVAKTDAELDRLLLVLKK
jgi:hypothetical protein